MGAGLGGGVSTAGFCGGGRGSPGDSASSCGSSYEGSEERDDHHGTDGFLLRAPPGHDERLSPGGKRIRLTEGWAT